MDILEKLTRIHTRMEEYVRNISFEYEFETLKEKKVYDWHQELTKDQMEELISETIQPGDAEYFHALRNYGIRDDGPFHYEDEVVVEKIVFDSHYEVEEKLIQELIKEGILPEDANVFLRLRNSAIRDNEEFRYNDYTQESERVMFFYQSLMKKLIEGLIEEGILAEDEILLEQLIKDGRKDDNVGINNKKDVSIPKTGLQIFRDQFNLMPEIENRHTLSERLQIVQAIGTSIGVAVIAINPVIGIAIAGTSLVTRPIAYRLTGQKEIEKEIEDQFLEMEEKEFDKMTDYLSEERIQDIKPNTCILRALHQAMIKRARKKIVALDYEVKSLKAKRDNLMEKGELTSSEDKLLSDIVSRLIQIEEEEAPEIQIRFKDVKRGKDRVSMMYKGNLATRFNIFAHRNTNTAEYREAINRLADAEYNRDISISRRDNKSAALWQKEMESVMCRYTSTNALGIQNSVFNNRGAPVRIVSDRLDNTLKHLVMLTTAGVGANLSIKKLKEYQTAQTLNSAEHEHIVNQYNSAGDGIEQIRVQVDKIKTETVLDNNSARILMDGQVRQVADMGEVGAIHTTGVTTTDTYRKLDVITNLKVDRAKNDANLIGNDSADLLKRLAQHIRKHSIPVASDLENIARTRTGNNTWIADHSNQLNVQSQAVQQVEEHAKLYDRVAEVLDEIKKLKGIKLPKMTKFSSDFRLVEQSFMGPIISGLCSVMGVGKNMIESRSEKQSNSAVDISKLR